MSLADKEFSLQLLRAIALPTSSREPWLVYWCLKCLLLGSIIQWNQIQSDKLRLWKTLISARKKIQTQSIYSHIVTHSVYKWSWFLVYNWCHYLTYQMFIEMKNLFFNHFYSSDPPKKKEWTPSPIPSLCVSDCMKAICLMCVICKTLI